MVQSLSRRAATSGLKDNDTSNQLKSNLLVMLHGGHLARCIPQPHDSLMTIGDEKPEIPL